MKLLFVKNPQQIGGMYGFSTHIAKMKEALSRLSDVTVTMDPKENFDIAVHVASTLEFEPIRGKRIFS